MQPFQELSSWWLGRAPEHPLSRPSSFRGVETFFRLDVMQIFNNVQMNGWSCSPKHGPAQFTSLSQLFVGMVWNISKTFETLAGSCSPKHGPYLFTVLQNFFVWMLCSHFKNFQVDGWAALPNISCHGPAHFAALNMNIVLMLCRLSTTFKWTAGRAPPNTVQLKSRCWVNFSSGWREAFQKHSKIWLGRVTRNTAQFLFTMLRNFFVWMLCNHFENIQVDGWAALPNIPCHGPARFAALNIGIVLMLCRLSTTFKWTVGRAPPNTVQLKSRCWVNFSSGWREAFQKHSNFKLGRAPPNTVQLKSRCWVNLLPGWREAFQKHSNFRLGRAPPNTAQFLSRCWRIFSSGCYANISKTFKVMAGPRSPTSSVTAQLI